MKQVQSKDRVLLDLLMQIDYFGVSVSAGIEFGYELDIQTGVLMNRRC
jgi:hypothetical protein